MLITWLLSALTTLIVVECNLSIQSNIHSSVISQTNVECDYSRYKYGCEDSIGSECVSKQCACKRGYTIKLRYGYCLKPLSIGEECITSSQCNHRHNNSQCISRNADFSEWWCQCKPDYFYDANNTNVCVNQLKYGQQCNASEQCLGDHSVCDGVSAKCSCHALFIYNFTLNRCIHVNNTGCDDGFEWNKHTNNCDHKVFYSNKGGGGRGGGGSRGGGSRSSSRGSSRSFGYGSGSGSGWFYKSRGPRFVGGTGGSTGSSTYTEEELDVLKVILVVVGMVAVILAFCYCSWKMKQYDAEDKQYYENRASIKRNDTKASTDAIKLFNRDIAKTYNIDMPIQSNNTDRDNNQYLHTSFGAPLPSCSPPPPYSEDGKILPYSSPHSPSHVSLHTDERPRSTYENSSIIEPSAPDLPVFHPQDSNKLLPFATTSGHW